MSWEMSAMSNFWIIWIRNATGSPPRDLARYFGVSGRQIRSYVAAINRSSETQPLIESSNKGYRLSRAPVPDRPRLSEDSLPILPAQRGEHIITALLRSPGGCNVFDLAESLFISVPTLENDLGKIRRGYCGDTV